MFTKVAAYLAVDGSIHLTEDEAGLASIDYMLNNSLKKECALALINELKTLAKNQEVMNWLTDYIKK